MTRTLDACQVTSDGEQEPNVGKKPSIVSLRASEEQRCFKQLRSGEEHTAIMNGVRNHLHGNDLVHSQTVADRML